MRSRAEEHQERHAGYPPGDDLPVSEGEPTREEVLEIELSQLRSAYDELAGQVQELTAERDALRKADEWQPIETAPKDGTEVVVRDGVDGSHSAIFTTYRGITDWFHSCNMGWLPSARYWKPLPNTPAKQSEGE